MQGSIRYSSPLSQLLIHAGMCHIPSFSWPRNYNLQLLQQNPKGPLADYKDSMGLLETLTANVSRPCIFLIPSAAKTQPSKYIHRFRYNGFPDLWCQL